MWIYDGEKRERGRAHGELLTRAIADDLDEHLLVSANALHRIAKVLRVLVGVDVLFEELL